METDETVGTKMNVYYSQTGSTWTLFTGVTVISGDEKSSANKVTFKTPHLTYYALTEWFTDTT